MSIDDSIIKCRLEMTEILRDYATITLDEMREIRLMNRIDTKFITTEPMLRRLLDEAREDYYVQETDGLLLSPYHTLYFDTPDCAMYNRHEAGYICRQKLRIRSYQSVGLSFLEVKTKNNHGRTKKKRVKVDAEDCELSDYDDFLREHLHYDPMLMTPQMENHFDRITLVNKQKTERLTIDVNLRFHNIATDQRREMKPLVIIELKRDGLKPSPILAHLRALRIHPHGFSKYCIGSALTNDALRRNRIKPRLHSIDKMMNR